MCAWWCCTPIAGTPQRAREPRREARAEEVRDAGRARRRRGSTSRIADQVLDRVARAPSQVGALSRSPMCCETNASSPRVTQTVFLNQPPMASTGGPGARRAGSPAACSRARGGRTGARAGAAGAHARCRRSGRRCRGRATRNASAMPREPRERLVVAGHQRLAARVGAGHHQHQGCGAVEPRRARRAARGLVEQQVLQRRVRQHRAEPREAGRDAGQRASAPARLRSSTIGRSARFEQRALGRADLGQRRERRDVRRPSPRTASPRATCARAAAPPPRRCARRRRGGSRPAP